MDFKNRLYINYVSSEQAGSETLEKLKNGEGFFNGHAPYINKLIERFIPSDRKIRIVDLGCGHGTYLYFLKQKGYKNIVGIDTSAEQVTLAQKLGITEVQQGTIEKFLIHDTQPVDVFLLIDILEHLPQQVLFDLLDKVYTKLNNGGTIIIHVPNAEGIFGMRIRYGDLTHEQAFTPTSMRQLLKTIGFSAISYIEEKPVVHGLKSFFRRIIWSSFSLPLRLLLMAETGKTHFVLSQNMLVIAKK